VASTNIIKSLGATDIDTQELVKNLVAATKAPRQKLIDVEKKKAEVAISTTALVSKALSTLQTTATEISSLGKLNQLTVSSGDTAVITGTSSGTGAARAGNYAVTVTQLADSQRRSSNELASSFTTTASQTLTFSAAAGASGFVTSATAAENVVTIPAASTPATVVSLINASTIATNNKLKATLVDKKTAAGGTGPYVIVIQGQSGTKNGFSILTTDAGVAGRDELGLDRAITAAKPTDNAAANATFSVNNIALERSSNTVTDAISGVSLSLKKTASATTVNLTVAANSAALVSNVKNFVASFNLLSDLVKRATGPAVEGDDVSGTLKADSSARGIYTALRAKVIKESSSKSGAVTHFNSLGVSFDRNGVLQFDDSKLTAAMESAPDDVIKALSNNRESPSTAALLDSGLAGDVAIAAAGMLKSTGVIKAMTAGFENRKTLVATKQSKLDKYIESIQEQYEKQFSTLNTVLSEFKATSERLKNSFQRKSE